MDLLFPILTMVISSKPEVTETMRLWDMLCRLL